MKKGGKEVGPASVYAKPHTMDGKAMKISSTPGKEPSSSKLDTIDASIGNISKSAGNEQVKTTGIKMRGTGAATKGVMSRGPMA
jgi:hypothetical protein